MKLQILTAILATTLGASVSAQSESDMLENLTAVLASEHICNFNVNREMVGISVNAMFGDPATVAPGGRHWPEIQRNMSRIESLTETNSGRQSFCRSTKSSLSAFFD